MYTKPFEAATAVSIFTNDDYIVVADDNVERLRGTIITSTEATGQTDITIITPIVNGINPISFQGNPSHRYPFQSALTIQSGFLAAVTANSTNVIIMLNTASIFVDHNTFGIMDLSGVHTTAPV
mmetsp:Transcript_43435/g.47120  ORF Transcript_43435/g.47120 Transcript_43435/m.47120 type:complete len:124 (+) Transcript_43435:133-504(+)